MDMYVKRRVPAFFLSLSLAHTRGVGGCSRDNNIDLLVILRQGDSPAGAAFFYLMSAALAKNRLLACAALIPNCADQRVGKCATAIYVHCESVCVNLFYVCAGSRG
jgi:hypothetical protein